MGKKALQKCIVIFLVIFLQSFFSCGLPVFYVIYTPVNAVIPTISSQGRVFTFQTSDNQNKSNDIYLGTDVYYKIYNNKVVCDADIDAINKVNTEFSRSGFTKLEGLGYAKLKASPPLHSNSDILFDKNANSYTVTIRLFTEGVDESYKAGFISQPNVFSNMNSIPFRETTNSTFDFENSPPGRNDLDYTYTENSEDENYFVAAYAVAVGRDGSFQSHYSSLLFLGVINIPKYIFD